MSYPAAVLADSPVRYFHFDEASGTVAIDYAGSSANATYVGGITLSQGSLLSAYANNSVLGDGTGYVNCGTGAIIRGLANWTIEAWCKTSDTTTTWMIYSERSATENDIVNFQTVDATKTALQLVYRDSAGTLNILPGSTISTLNDGNPHHLVCTKSGSTIAFFVDGVSAGGGTLTAASTQTASNCQCLFGSDTGTIYFKTSYLDEGALYTTALSPTRIAAHFHAGAVGATTYPVTLTATQPQTPRLVKSCSRVLVLSQSSIATVTRPLARTLTAGSAASLNVTKIVARTLSIGSGFGDGGFGDGGFGDGTGLTATASVVSQKPVSVTLTAAVSAGVSLVRRTLKLLRLTQPQTVTQDTAMVPFATGRTFNPSRPGRITQPNPGQDE